MAKRISRVWKILSRLKHLKIVHNFEQCALPTLSVSLSLFPPRSAHLEILPTTTIEICKSFQRSFQAVYLLETSKNYISKLDPVKMFRENSVCS